MERPGPLDAIRLVVQQRLVTATYLPARDAGREGSGNRARCLLLGWDPTFHTREGSVRHREGLAESEVHKNALYSGRVVESLYDPYTQLFMDSNNCGGAVHTRVGWQGIQGCANKFEFLNWNMISHLI